MKKMKYLIMTLLVGVLGIGMVEAKSNPTFTADLEVTKKTGSDTINIEAVIKNSATTCNDVGLRDGKVYIYLDENIVKKPISVIGIYRDYDEGTGTYLEAAVPCSYDGANHRVECAFGRQEVNPAIVNYSDCKDELVITFETELCAGSDNCDIKVEVQGESIDYNNGKPTSISNGVKTMMTKNFDCNSQIDEPTTPNNPTTPNKPSTPTTPDEPTYEPDENPNTIDNGLLYILMGALSLILIGATMALNKKGAY